MDILEKYLNSISYKFPKGYPDIKDDQDKSMLFKMINEIIEERWGGRWGKRNIYLRDQFQYVLDNSDFYDNTIQKKLFNFNINDGPKRIEDFE